SANAGGAGNSTSTSAGWFFADRVNLPLVTEPDTGPNAPSPPEPIGQLPTINFPHFPGRNWSADWYSWLALNDFVGTSWQTINPPNPPSAAVSPWSWPTWVPYPPPANWMALNTGGNGGTALSKRHGRRRGVRLLDPLPAERRGGRPTTSRPSPPLQGN